MGPSKETDNEHCSEEKPASHARTVKVGSRDRRHRVLADREESRRGRSGSSYIVLQNEHAAHHTVKRKRGKEKTRWHHPKKLTMNTASRGLQSKGFETPSIPRSLQLPSFDYMAPEAHHELIPACCQLLVIIWPKSAFVRVTVQMLCAMDVDAWLIMRRHRCTLGYNIMLVRLILCPRKRRVLDQQNLTMHDPESLIQESPRQ